MNVAQKEPLTEAVSSLVRDIYEGRVREHQTDLSHQAVVGFRSDEKASYVVIDDVDYEIALPEAGIGGFDDLVCRLFDVLWGVLVPPQPLQKRQRAALERIARQLEHDGFDSSAEWLRRPDVRDRYAALVIVEHP